MVDRIIFNKDGVKVSKPGFNAATTTNVNLCMHPNMEPMIPVYNGSATFTGNGTQTFSFTNTRGDIPVTIILRANDGRMPNTSSTFYATTQSPFNTLKIHNIDGMARTIQFRVLF